MEKEENILPNMKRVLHKKRFQVWPGKSNLKENTWKGKVMLNAFYAVDYQVGK